MCTLTVPSLISRATPISLLLLPVATACMTSADDHPIVQEGLVALLSRQSNLEVVALARDGREAVEESCRTNVDSFSFKLAIKEPVSSAPLICFSRSSI